MSFKIYINNCKNGDYHIGCLNDKTGIIERTVPENEFGSIESSVSISLNNGIIPSFEEIDKAIDEAFSKFNKPLQDNERYNENVTNDIVDIIPKGSFGKNAEEIKNELRDVVSILRKRGRHVKIS
jgi:hypothetical protein